MTCGKDDHTGWENYEVFDVDDRSKPEKGVAMKPTLNRREFLQGMGATAACASLEIGHYATTASQASASVPTYYIDPATGDDDHDGLTPTRPFKTYAARQFTGGDTILFKRGSVIRDMLYTCNGTEQSPITYGAYGEGAKPAFLGSVPVGFPDKWVEERPSVWRFTETLSSEVCNLIFNDGRSCGNLRWQIEDLRRPGEWHYTGLGKQHQGGDLLYLCSPANPGRAYTSIECVLWGRRKLVGAQRNVILEHLSFRNSGVHGYQQSQVRQVVIRNCEFRFIGGAVWNRDRRIRFGNAIEFWDGASDVKVEGCLFDNIYDSGVTHQGGGIRNIPERLSFRDNLFIDCGLTAYESREPSREVYFEHNTCLNAGGGFSMQGETPPRQSDPYPQPLGYHVWAWMIDPRTQPGNVNIHHNLFCESFGPAICLSLDLADAQKFILDHNCYWQTTPGRLIDWGERRSYPRSEFARYQTECSRDLHSRMAKPLFVDASRRDFRQRADSPCLSAGMRIEVGRR